MISKPEYIKGLENGKPFSTLELGVPDDFQKFLDGRDLITVFSDSWMEFEIGEIKTICKIYLTKQFFYLFLLNGNVDNKTLVIYYNEEQLNELKIFIKQLLKTYKNGAINNK
jgi:hypothetical protein|tara:strand:- start:2371 stop:2706 length:336 start_codon:yes stop_codon:yes gene_type:complete